MVRTAVLVSLPPAERELVCDALAAADLDAIAVNGAVEAAAALDGRRGVTLAILDGERDFDELVEIYSLLAEDDRRIPALMVIAPRSIDWLGSAANRHDEFLTRPYSPESLRWRVEAMLIRQATVDDGSGPVLEGAPMDTAAWGSRGQLVAIFNPKGGVGKTTIALNLAATLQVRRGLRTYLIDADTVSGHIASSLGIEHVRTVADARIDEADGGPAEALTELAAAHPSGMRVVTVASSPARASAIVPDREADAIAGLRRSAEVVIVDLHPDYDPLNRALFDRCDRILVPVTPDVPAIRAAVQLRDLATEVGFANRLAMIVNRANTGVSVADMERTVGMPAVAQIRSAGLLFVRAANEGRTVIERFPKEKVTEDFDALADYVAGRAERAVAAPRAVFPRLFGRQREAPQTL